LRSAAGAADGRGLRRLPRQRRQCLLDEYCCHRNASLTLGRAEGGGLRCIYHGWKFAVDGTVLETPNAIDGLVIVVLGGIGTLSGR
jgi:nitrite reductase/ring-hydroxylating ferredoxin subunit